MAWRAILNIMQEEKHKKNCTWTAVSLMIHVIMFLSLLIVFGKDIALVFYFTFNSGELPIKLEQ